ncbi:MAG: hypothetical protein R3C60_05880 [Parvularculaceae bacterium]
MEKKNLARFQIVHALIWAAAMIAAAFLFKGEPFAKDIPLYGALAFVIINSLVVAGATKRQC